MKIRMLLALVMVLVSLLGVAYAQDINPCFSLSEEDCALIGEATLNTATYLDGVGSMTIDLDLSMAANDIPDSEPFSFDMTGSVDVVENTETQIGADVYGSFDVNVEAEGESEAITIEFWIVSDVLYFINPEDEGLYSVDLTQVLSESDLEDAIENPTEALGDELMSDSALEALTTLVTLPGLLDWNRDGDDFVFTIDFAALTDPNNQEALESLVEVVSETDPATGAQLESFLPLLPQLLESGTVNFTQGLNTELNIVDSYTLEANFVVATGMMMGDPQLPATTVDFLFSAGLGNFDGVEAPVAPEGATDITEEVVESLGGMFGSGE